MGKLGPSKTPNMRPIDDPTRVWRGLTHCPECGGLHDVAQPCGVCGNQLSASPSKIIVEGEVVEVPAITQGAMPWSVFVMLRHIALECERPVIDSDHAVGKSAQRLSVVLIFWTLFETLMHGFYRAALADLPGTLGDELLDRFQSIGSRLDRLHKRIWGTTYWIDLEAHGHGETAAFLRLLQSKRNAFVHGDPEAIDDELVGQTLRMMESIQASWITLFNMRCTRRQRRIPLWHA